MLQSTRMLAAIGSLLLFLSIIPGFHLASLIGVILFLTGMYQLAEIKNEKAIFQEALWAFLIGVIGEVF